MIKTCLIRILALTVLWSSQGYSAFSNYNSILIGEQAAGLGGAYTALWGDASASPYYNPGGLVWMEGNSFSASVSVYKKFDTVMGKDEDFIKAPLRVNQGYFQSIPSSTGSIVKYKDMKVGLSIVVPDYETYKGEINTTSTNTSVLHYQDESLWVGPTIGWQFGKKRKHAVGLTAYYTARNYSRSVQDRTIDTDINIFSEDKTITGNSLVFVFGYLVRFNKEISWGISLRPPGLEIAGTGTYLQNSMSSTGGTLNTPTTISKTELKSHTRIPGKLTAGIAWQNSKWKVACDGSFYSAENYFDFEDTDVRNKIQHQVIPGGALGVEYKWYPWFIARMGGYTNLSSQKELTSADRYGDRVDQLGFAANVTFISNEQIHFTFGGYYTGGKGKTVQRINQVYEVIPKSYQVFTMLIGTSYSF